MTTLKLVSNRNKPPIPQTPPLATLHVGCRYHIAGSDISKLNVIHGVVGDYQITSEQARIHSFKPEIGIDQMNACCFWDTDIDLSRHQSYVRDEITGQSIPLEECRIKSNRMVMNQQSLYGPELLDRDGDVILTMTPQFDFTFSTDSYTAQVGAIHLVQATRFITLENGGVIHLLNTHDSEAPVLFRESSTDEMPVKLVGEQQELGVTRDYRYDFSVSQSIPETFAGEAVATVTVLEQYHTYFMQRAVPFDDQLNMWIPIHAPLQWGWSIRVGHRADEEWGILKRKVIIPTTGNDGLQIPVWDDNTINCSRI